MWFKGSHIFEVFMGKLKKMNKVLLGVRELVLQIIKISLLFIISNGSIFHFSKFHINKRIFYWRFTASEKMHFLS